MCITLFVMEGLTIPVTDALDAIDARQVVENIDQLLEQGQDMTAEITATLSDHRERRVAMCRKNYSEAGYENKFMFFVLKPNQERSAGLLVWNYKKPGEEDDQWGYHPGEKKIRRITGNDKKDAFMGTDFTFIDLGDWDVNDYDYTYGQSREEMIDGIACYHIYVTPKNDEISKKTGYEQMEIWVRPDLWMIVQAYFYDKKDHNEPLKELKVDKIEEFQGISPPTRISAPTQVTIRNNQKKHWTVLKFENVQYNTGLANGVFDQDRLRNNEPCFRIK